MQINIRAKSYEPTEEIKEYVHEKVGNVSKYLSNIKDAYVELEHDTHHRSGDVSRAEITLHLVGDGEIIRGEDSASDMHAAIDNAVGKLKHGIERYKGTRNHVDKEAVRQLRETE